MAVKASANSKVPGSPVVIRHAVWKHVGHPLSVDRRTYSANRKLEAEDFEYARSLMTKGSTPKEVLKVSFKGIFYWIY